MFSWKHSKGFAFESREPKSEKLPSTLKQAKDFRQKRADENLTKSNLFMLGIAGLLFLVLVILWIAKKAIVG